MTSAFDTSTLARVTGARGGSGPPPGGPDVFAAKRGLA